MHISLQCLSAGMIVIDGPKLGKIQSSGGIETPFPELNIGLAYFKTSKDFQDNKYKDLKYLRYIVHINLDCFSYKELPIANALMSCRNLYSTYMIPTILVMML